MIKGSTKVVKLLLVRGISLNILGTIRVVVENSYKNVIYILLVNSSDINTKGREDNSNAL